MQSIIYGLSHIVSYSSVIQSIESPINGSSTNSISAAIDNSFAEAVITVDDIAMLHVIVMASIMYVFLFIVVA